MKKSLLCLVIIGILVCSGCSDDLVTPNTPKTTTNTVSENLTTVSLIGL